jgi:hypothetical protein
MLNYIDWDFLKGFMGCDFKDLLKGQLSENRADMGLYDTLRRIDYSMLMCQLFDIRGSDYSNWEKEDWVYVIIASLTSSEIHCRFGGLDANGKVSSLHSLLTSHIVSHPQRERPS